MYCNPKAIVDFQPTVPSWPLTLAYTNKQNLQIASCKTDRRISSNDSMTFYFFVNTSKMASTPTVCSFDKG